MSDSALQAVHGIARIASQALLGSIAIYRLAISPWLPARCRYTPSCSAYAAEAIAVHGPLRGSRLAIMRVARCHPWHDGGHDPVPPAGPAACTDHRADRPAASNGSVDRCA